MNRDITTPIVFMDSADQELQHHIDDLSRHIETSYARFEQYGNPADRDAAIEFAHMRAVAIASRSPAAIEALETRLGLGQCQFTVMGEEARAALETRL